MAAYFNMGTGMTSKRLRKPGEARSKHRRIDGFDTVEAAIVAFQAGQMVIVVDDEDRENEDVVSSVFR